MNATAHSSRVQTPVYCIDLAKNVFQVHRFTRHGRCLARQRLSRARFSAFVADPHRPRGTVVMEACGSSHHWGRRFQAQGDTVKLVPPQFVAKRRHGNKTDGNDADTIFAVHQDARVRPVPVKTLAQQDTLARHRYRELLGNQRTQLINHLRSILQERGHVERKGDGGLASLVRRLGAGELEGVSPELTRQLLEAWELICNVDKKQAALDKALATQCREDPEARRLTTIFGVGPITATAVVATHGPNVGRFASAGQFAASMGTTPKEDSSGERRRLGGITRRGDGYLRRLLCQCSQSIVMHAHRRDDALSRLVGRLQAAGKQHNVIIIAVANRLARIMYAMLRDAADYRHQAPVDA
jgi:transposase